MTVINQRVILPGPKGYWRVTLFLCKQGGVIHYSSPNVDIENSDMVYRS